MSTASTLITAEEFARMSFDTPVELVRGEIREMTIPGGWHGRVCSRATYLLERWAETVSAGRFLILSNDPGVIVTRDPDSVRGPDVLAIRKDRLPDGQLPRKHFIAPPDVAVEVKSPSDRRREIQQKTLQFLAVGVGEVWVIDPDHFRVHVYRDHEEPAVLDCDDTLTSQFLPGFECQVRDFFQGII